jgi:hypothetical protein
MTEATALTDQLAIAYRDLVELNPGVKLWRDSWLEKTILEVYADQIDDDAMSRVYQLFTNEKPELCERLSVRALAPHPGNLFRQPIVPLIYLLAWEHPFTTKLKWPRPVTSSLRPVYVDLGMAGCFWR